jgi:two-component system, cell cycle sensor histidine kinase and response regulator CckA
MSRPSVAFRDLRSAVRTSPVAQLAVKFFTAPPSAGDDSIGRPQLLYNLIALTFVNAAILFAAHLVFQPPTFRILFAALVLVLQALLTKYIAEVKGFKWGAAMYIGLNTLVAIAGAYAQGGGFRPMGFSAFYGIILVVTIFFGTRPAVVAAAATVLYAVVLSKLEAAGQLPPAALQPTAGMITVLFGVTFFNLVVIVAYFVKALRESLGRIQREASERVRSEMILSSVINGSPDLIVVVDRNLNIIVANDAIRTVVRSTYGLDIEPGMPIHQILPAQSQIDITLEHYCSILSGKKEIILHVSTSPSGSQHFESTFYAIKDQKNDIIGIATITRNITEQQKYQHELQLREQAFSTVFDESPFILVINDGATGKYLDVNKEFLKHFTMPREAIIGKTPVEVSLVSIETHIGLREKLQRQGFLSAEETHATIQKTGEERDFLYWTREFTIQDAPVLLTALQDITERKHGERKLKESEERYRMLVERSGLLVAELDSSGRYLFVNRNHEKILGYSPEELIGKSQGEFIHADQIVRYHRLLHEQPTVGVGLTMQFRKKDGSYIWLETTAQLYRTPQGENHVVAIAKDISQLVNSREKEKNLETQLLRSQKLESLGTLVGGISHDFNNILHIIVSYSSMALEKTLDPWLQSRLQKVLKGAERGAVLVRQLLTFARKTEVKVEPIDINSVVRDMTELLKETFPRTIDIINTLPNDVPFIQGDKGQIHQILLNLCVNARDAMPDGGEIAISTCVEQYAQVRKKFSDATASSYVHIEVRDNGTGMDEKTRSRIFEPFFTTKEMNKGTGLGLSVVFGVVEGHNGFINVESEVGKGSAFHIWLPVAHKARNESEELETATTSDLYGSETILLIEDEQLVREALEEQLIEFGYHVMTARDGSEGITLFERYHDSIRVVVTDLGLPKATGESVIKAIRELKPGMKIVVLSGHIDPDVRRRLLDHKIQSIIEKPCVPVATIAIVRKVLNEKA